MGSSLGKNPLLMCDWLSAQISTVDHSSVGYDTGRGYLIDRHGVIEKEFPRWQQVEHPSHSGTLSVLSPSPDALRLAGSPAKFLQGHNCWGGSDVLELLLLSGGVLRPGGLFPSPGSYGYGHPSGFGAPTFSRLDITRSYRFCSNQLAHEFVRDVAGQARTRMGKSTLYNDSSAVFGEKSRRWGMVVYCKLDELIKHPPKGLPLSDQKQLTDWSDGIVRFELRARGLEFKQAIWQAYFRDFLTTPGEEWLCYIWKEYYNKITWNRNSGGFDMATVNELKVVDRPVLAAWSTGVDMRLFLPSTSAFYRRRRRILDAVGIDIASPPSHYDDANRRVAVALSMDDPNWDPIPVKLSGDVSRDSSELSRQYGFRL